MTSLYYVRFFFWLALLRLAITWVFVAKKPYIWEFNAQKGTAGFFSFSHFPQIQYRVMTHKILSGSKVVHVKNEYAGVLGKFLNNFLSFCQNENLYLHGAKPTGNRTLRVVLVVVYCEPWFLFQAGNKPVPFRQNFRPRRKNSYF